MAFGMVDATYAILLSRPKSSLRFCLQVTILNYAYWFFGSVIGALFADLLPQIQGIDFILTAFFMILVLDFYFVHPLHRTFNYTNCFFYIGLLNSTILLPYFCYLFFFDFYFI